MADERDDDFDGNESTDQKTAGQRSDQSEYGAQGPETMRNQGAEGSFGGESIGSQSGSADANGSSIAGGTNDGMSGQPIGGNDSNTGSGTTLTQGADFGHGTTSNAGGSSVGVDQTSGGSSGVSGGKGFIGSQDSGSDDDLPDRSGSQATGSSGFAKEGRGALEREEENESGDESSR